MAQFDVYENKNTATSAHIPYLLDIQHAIMSKLDTRVVVPLAIGVTPARILSPVFEVKGVKVVMLTPQLAGIAVSELGEKICSLTEHREAILAALDFLVVGY